MTHTESVKRYNLQKYDRIEITVPKGRKSELQDHIKQKYIDTCIDGKMTVNKLLNKYIDRELNGEAGKGMISNAREENNQNHHRNTHKA